MNRVFEDEFMDVQASIISLCLELTGEKVDKVYAYCSNEKYCQMFNAFFVINGEVKTTEQLKIPDDLAFQFMGFGLEDIERLNTVCKKYNMPAPTELKLYYDVKSGKFNADYKYEEVCSGNTDIDQDDIFLEWIAEVKAAQTNR